MTNADTEQIGGQDDAGITATVDDPEQYSQTRRLRALHDTRDTVRRIRREAAQGVEQSGRKWGNFREPERDAHTAAAVVDYLLEAESILRRVDANPPGPGPYGSLFEFLEDNIDPHTNPPPLEVSLGAYRICTRSLATHGIGIATETDDEWEI